ncbi:signaling protein domain protein [Blomia tropicalis]|nr:signaling protein domain protein [Blomia tropicalis]
MARLRDDGDQLIELFAEVALPQENNSNAEPFTLRTYPEDYSNKDILSSVPLFAYPCSFRCDVVTHFSFVLTNNSAKWLFGYCRHTPKSDTCLVILSDLPWHSTFYRILDHCAELSTRQSSIPLEHFLEALYSGDLPQPGLELNVTYTCEDLKLREFKAPCPDHQKLPCIPEDRNVTEYFSAVNASNMIAIFASMLNERRIVITSDRLSRLSACVQAANALIYPMHWQHIFIPLLPSHLLDYLSAPMPFLIGVPQVTLAKVKPNEMGDIVLLNADTNQLRTPFDDVSTLPSEVLHNLRKSLKQSSAALGDGLCRAFMRALVSLIGGYRSALRIVPGKDITFERDLFVSSVRGTSRQLFLEKMLQLQIFQQFIETRLDLFNNGERLDDQFEIELNHMEVQSGSSRFKAQYREWTSTMKKEGGAFLRAVNPKVKSAISKSRQAVRNIRSAMKPPMNSLQSRPTSAPSSPKLPPKIKKSISGTAISQTSRTVTYVRTPSSTTMASKGSVTTNTGSSNGSSNSSRSSTIMSPSNVNNSNNNNGHHLMLPNFAPSASAESSDIDEPTDTINNVPRLDMNITSELEDLFRSKSSINGGSNVQTESFPNTTAPIPPPRTDKFSVLTRHALKPSIRPTTITTATATIIQPKCLIEFDSPPKDQPKPNQSNMNTNIGALAFDPLFETNNGDQSKPSVGNSLFYYDVSNVNNGTPSNLFHNPPLQHMIRPRPPPRSNIEQTNQSPFSSTFNNHFEPSPFNTSNLITRFEKMSQPAPPPTKVTHPFQQIHRWQEFD